MYSSSPHLVNVKPIAVAHKNCCCKQTAVPLILKSACRLLFAGFVVSFGIVGVLSRHVIINLGNLLTARLSMSVLRRPLNSSKTILGLLYKTSCLASTRTPDISANHRRTRKSEWLSSCHSQHASTNDGPMHYVRPSGLMELVLASLVEPFPAMAPPRTPPPLADTAPAGAPGRSLQWLTKARKRHHSVRGTRREEACRCHRPTRFWWVRTLDVRVCGSPPRAVWDRTGFSRAGAQ